ncbi:MAG: hypothetical protein RL753_625, partial [Bacteroidota bacterium]
KMVEVPKNPQLVEVQVINRLDAVLEPAQSKLGVVEVGLHVRIKRLHRFDAEVATGKHRTELGCKNSLFRAFGEALTRPMNPRGVHEHHECAIQGILYWNGSEAKTHILGIVVPHNGFR